MVSSETKCIRKCTPSTSEKEIHTETLNTNKNVKQIHSNASSPVISFGQNTILFYDKIDTWESGTEELNEPFYNFSCDSSDDNYDSDNLKDFENIKKSLFYTVNSASSSSSTIATSATPSIEVKITNRQKYKCGINVAASFIVDHLLRYNEFSKNEIDIVTGMIVFGKEVDITSTKGKKFLRKVKNHDLHFAEMAFMAAGKVKDLGGNKIDMEAAVVATLACRGFRYLRNSSFTENQLEIISDWTARAVMNKLDNDESDIRQDQEIKEALPFPSKNKTRNAKIKRNLFHKIKSFCHEKSTKLPDEENLHAKRQICNYNLLLSKCHVIFMEIFSCDTFIADLNAERYYICNGFNKNNEIITMKQNSDEATKLAQYKEQWIINNLDKKMRYAKMIG